MRALDPPLPPKIICRRRENRLEADVDLHVAALAGPRAGAAAAELQLALAVVLEDDVGALSYWALAHPPGKPDFHHSDGFASTLPRAGAA